MDDALEDLVVRARVGDEGAYGVIYERFKDMALSYAFSIVRNHDMAEDVRQQAFLSAYCDLLALRNPSAFPGWFKRIVERHAFRAKQLSGKIICIPCEDAPELASEGLNPEEVALREEKSGLIRSALKELPEDEREAALLFYLKDLSAPEVAKELGIPTRKVRYQLEKARERLRWRSVIMAKARVQKQRLSGDLRLNIVASKEAVEMFDAEIDSLTKRSEEERDKRLCDLICAKARLLRSMGEIDQAFATLNSGLAQPTFGRRPNARARIRLEVGITDVCIGDYSAAKEMLEKARTVVRRLKASSNLLPEIFNALGVCAWGEGEFKKARTYFEKTLEEDRLSENEILRTDARNNLALLDWKKGNLEQALAGMQACLKVWRRIKGRSEQAATLMHIGIMEENMGRFKLAGRHYGQALALAEEVNDLQTLVFIYCNLGNLDLTLKNWEGALAHNEKARELAKKTKDKRSEAIALENMALANVGAGNVDAVLPLVRKGRRIAQALDDKERLLSLELVKVEAQFRSGKTKGLLEDLAKAEEDLLSFSFISEYPRLLRLRGEAEHASGALSAALKTCRHARRLCRKQKATGELNRVAALLKKVERALKEQR